MSKSSEFVPDLTLPKCGLGAALAVWGFRASAMGGESVNLVVQCFDCAFGSRKKK